jgi:hypothetical protein
MDPNKKKRETLVTPGHEEEEEDKQKEVKEAPAEEEDTHSVTSDLTVHDEDTELEEVAASAAPSRKRKEPSAEERKQKRQRHQGFKDEMGKYGIVRKDYPRENVVAVYQMWDVFGLRYRDPDNPKHVIYESEDVKRLFRNPNNPMALYRCVVRKHMRSGRTETLDEVVDAITNVYGTYLQTRLSDLRLNRTVKIEWEEIDRVVPELQIRVLMHILIIALESRTKRLRIHPVDVAAHCVSFYAFGKENEREIATTGVDYLRSLTSTFEDRNAAKRDEFEHRSASDKTTVRDTAASAAPPMPPVPMDTESVQPEEEPPMHPLHHGLENDACAEAMRLILCIFLALRERIAFAPERVPTQIPNAEYLLRVGRLLLYPDQYRAQVEALQNPRNMPMVAVENQPDLPQDLTTFQERRMRLAFLTAFEDWDAMRLAYTEDHLRGAQLHREWETQRKAQRKATELITFLERFIHGLQTPALALRAAMGPLEALLNFPADDAQATLAMDATRPAEPEKVLEAVDRHAEAVRTAVHTLEEATDALVANSVYASPEAKESRAVSKKRQADRDRNLVQLYVSERLRMLQKTVLYEKVLQTLSAFLLDAHSRLASAQHDVEQVHEYSRTWNQRVELEKLLAQLPREDPNFTSFVTSAVRRTPVSALSRMAVLLRELGDIANWVERETRYRARITEALGPDTDPMDLDIDAKELTPLVTSLAHVDTEYQNFVQRFSALHLERDEKGQVQWERLLDDRGRRQILASDTDRGKISELNHTIRDLRAARARCRKEIEDVTADLKTQQLLYKETAKIQELIQMYRNWGDAVTLAFGNWYTKDKLIEQWIEYGLVPPPARMELDNADRETQWVESQRRRWIGVFRGLRAEEAKERWVVEVLRQLENPVSIPIPVVPPVIKFQIEEEKKAGPVPPTLMKAMLFEVWIQKYVCESAPHHVSATTVGQYLREWDKELKKYWGEMVKEVAKQQERDAKDREEIRSRYQEFLFAAAEAFYKELDRRLQDVVAIPEDILNDIAGDQSEVLKDTLVQWTARLFTAYRERVLDITPEDLLKRPLMLLNIPDFSVSEFKKTEVKLHREEISRHIAAENALKRTVAELKRTLAEAKADQNAYRTQIGHLVAGGGGGGGIAGDDVGIHEDVTEILADFLQMVAGSIHQPIDVLIQSIFLNGTSLMRLHYQKVVLGAKAQAQVREYQAEALNNARGLLEELKVGDAKAFELLYPRVLTPAGAHCIRSAWTLLKRSSPMYRNEYLRTLLQTREILQPFADLCAAKYLWKETEGTRPMKGSTRSGFVPPLKIQQIKEQMSVSLNHMLHRIEYIPGGDPRWRPKTTPLLLLTTNGLTGPH